MNVDELRQQLEGVDGDTEVFLRCVPNPCGNITEAGRADLSRYGFFGKSLPCVIIEPDIGDYD